MELSVAGQDADAVLDELALWLGREAELRGTVKRGVRTPDSGTLGPAGDILIAAVGSGGALSVLAASLKAFLSLPRRSDIRIIVSSKDGTRLEIDAKRVADVESLIRQTFADGDDRCGR